MRAAAGPSGLTLPARARALDRALDRRAWRFHARGSWAADWRAATSVFDGASLMSVAWNGYLGKYVAVSARMISPEILVRAADRPEGPWSDVAIVEGSRRMASMTGSAPPWHTQSSRATADAWNC